MSPNKLFVTAAAIAVAAGAAILAPGIASGAPQVPLLPASSVVAPHSAPGDPADDEGGGKAWGHHKDDPGFPGNNGHGRDKDSGDSPDHGGGNGWGHHKDDPGFPGSNGRGHERDAHDD